MSTDDDLEPGSPGSPERGFHTADEDSELSRIFHRPAIGMGVPSNAAALNGGLLTPRLGSAGLKLREAPTVLSLQREEGSVVLSMTGAQPAMLVAAAPALRACESAQCAPATCAFAYLAACHPDIFLALRAVTLLIDGHTDASPA